MAESLKPPKHLAIIPDGNRRWAEAHGVSIEEGHRQGYRNVRKIARAAMDMGVEHLSVYAFSTENWQRTEEEVGGLMKLLKWAITHELKSIDKEDIRLRFAGSEDELDDELVKRLKKAEAKTADNTRGDLILCINYGGQREITDAVRDIAQKGIPAEQIDEQTIAEHLYLPDVPPVDLVIRTSGEQRLSNFLPWQAAYAELMFSDKLWPDFNETDLAQAFQSYDADRERRFGV